MKSLKKTLAYAVILFAVGLIYAAPQSTFAAPSDDFVITISTNSGLFTIPTNPANNTYSYQVDWNNDQDLDDPDESTVHTGDVTYDFGGSVTQTIRIVGAFPAIYFNSSESAQSLLSVDQWGTGVWTTMQSAFAGCTSLTSVSALDNPNLSGVTDISAMFQGATSFNGDLSSWDTTYVNNMSFMFDDATSFNGDITEWNTSAVTDMSYMFSGAVSFNQDISGDGFDSWLTSSVTDMSEMFSGASVFNQDIGGWDTSSVTSMRSMFQGASAFNQDIGGWSISSVVDTSYMFQDASAFNSDISLWSMSSVTNTSRMFAGATLFNQSIGGDGVDFWLTSSVTDMSEMFSGASAFNQSLATWNTASVTDMSSMFYGATSFNQEIGGWSTGSVTNMNSMFYGATSFNQDISSWLTNSVTDMSSMFAGASSFNQYVGTWDTGLVTNMSYIFYDATSFNRVTGPNGIDLWNTSSVTDMSYMFFYATAFNQDIGGWNTTNVTNMENMFTSTPSFNQDIGGWSTGSVTDMSGMFQSASAFNSDISGWDIDQVTDMGGMLSDSGLDTMNYDALLVGWEAQIPLSSVVLEANGLEYCSAAVSRDNLVTSGLSINGDSLSCPDTYSVTYDGNESIDGTVPVDGSSPYAPSATVTVLGNTGSLVRTGYTFDNWNTSADGTGTDYAPAATFTISGNSTLYAQWIADAVPEPVSSTKSRKSGTARYCSPGSGTTSFCKKKTVSPSAPQVPPTPSTLPGSQELPGITQSIVPVRDLELGISGIDVTSLQNLLIGAGYQIPAGATGYFGQQTRSALSVYQAANGIIPAAGYFGPVTRAQMRAAGLVGLWW